MAYTTIDNPELYFQTKLYTGTAGAQSLTLDGDENMQPDFVWLKRRDGGAGYSHMLYDSVRGATKHIKSNATAAEVAVSDALTSFDSDGFTLGANTAGSHATEINYDGGSYASWNWKAGTSFTNDASATGIGSIDSTGSVNTDAGFSIMSYTGTGANATIAHGLGVAPNLMLIKARSVGNTWGVYHSSTGNTGALFLDDTSAFSSSSTYWNNTSPTSSVFTISTNTKVNQSSATYIAYCFADVQGYSKFGSYVGNGSATDGTYCHLGFSARWIMIKCSNAAGELWHIHDTKRTPTNTGTNSDGRIVYANSSAAETDSVHYRIEIYSNGFKAMNNNDSTNVSGNTYIYMAFAKNPFVTSTGVPATAR